MDIRKVKKLIEMLQDAPDIGEIEVREGEESVRLTRTPKTPSVPMPQQVQIPTPAATKPAPTAGPVTTAYAEVPDEAIEEGNGEVIKSPMVGTFYAAPAPDAEPFVREGTTVKQGDTLCIIEAMKTMNQIPAPVSGAVTKVFVEDRDPVEFDQPLMTIQP